MIPMATRMRHNDQVSEPVSPSPESISQFWSIARDEVGHTRLEFLLGQQQASVVEPPWMHLSSDQDEATALIEQLLEARTGFTTSPLSDYPNGEEDTPEPGELVIACTGEGVPAALLLTTETRIVDDPTGKLVEEKLRVLYPRKTDR